MLRRHVTVPVMMARTVMVYVMMRTITVGTLLHVPKAVTEAMHHIVGDINVMPDVGIRRTDERA